jgi:hypothetical protein
MRVDDRSSSRQAGAVALHNPHDALYLLEKLLTLKFGPLPEAIRARIEAADAEALDRWLERILTAETVEAAVELGRRWGLLRCACAFDRDWGSPLAVVARSQLGLRLPALLGVASQDTLPSSRDRSAMVAMLVSRSMRPSCLPWFPFRR